MKLTCQLKLLPSDDQREQLMRTMSAFNQGATHAARVGFADGVYHKNSLQKRCYYELRDQYGLSAQMAILAIWKAADCFTRDKSTCPVFREDGAVIYDQRTMSFKGIDKVSLLTLDGRIIVPVVFGEYQAGYLKRLKGQCDLIYRDGELYLYCTVELPEEPPIEITRFWGVDLGIVNIVTDSDGNDASGDEIERVRLRCMTHRQSYQKTGTKAAKRRLKTMSGKESRFRKWVNHTISKELVDYAKGTKAAIVLEDLTHIRRRMTVRKKQRSRQHSWRFSQLRQFIEYKALRAGVVVITVDARNTSRTCSKCGYVDKRNRKSQAEFSCKRCGVVKSPF